ncbi:DUF5908 family protein [Mucilaginibacter sp. RS28]|uniref:DUF5908 family protein n=1 Tax=Mucilaginibacter straminoryzae TaxID=2932774 RepID=A0A9X1X4C6_9SPHI|nr:DUF5908 family protein [Mucilaginibacter straminoryzae]MCJ8208324.1 DUF5908 family protein [Mucilaginibacter straminoryzae]
MPIEIRELVIKVAVDDNPNRGQLTEANLQQLKNQLIKECSKKILNKIKAEPER